MKIVDFKNAFALTPCDTSAMVAAAEAFDSTQTRNKGQLRYLTLEGFLTAEQVNYNGQPAFVVWYCKTHDCALSINAAQSLQSGAPVEVVFLAVDQIARRENCESIRFASARRGLLSMGTKLGYHFETVVMRKD